MSYQLNYKLEGEGHTIVLIHGLFGNLDNLGILARTLKEDYQVLSVDLRNHGLSFHSNCHNYESLAQDVADLLKNLNIQQVSIVGHSMGGKVAVKLSEIIEDQVERLIVLDMAPVKYHQNRHDNVFAGLKAVEQQKPANRKQAMEILSHHIELEGVRQFLGKSLYSEGDYVAWRFSVTNLFNNYQNILDWQPIRRIATPTLFIKGGESDYLTAEHQADIQKQFSQAKAHVIANTGHWLHAEKPAEVLRAIKKFL
ncbi:alpha/beta fold hydrolase [Vibrio sinensis]|uniref:Alpha/beta fold hydrolase n=1 Tax=Vibrio sinensis TaxID=2302434 RepID=A0A3A6RC78_9VIBR|nr:alpha/beta fold hydrolase [Vibrio sinensis]RJX74231.1 alpha/beta fold hydrolase [Vibrio sinensis]